MGDFKRLKDPIYGYIKIPVRYMSEIVDTPIFQRLRRIIQTSYSPLYPSALHNRFVHSIGVYHLGTLACASIKKEISNELSCALINTFQKVFLLACLLHDVGHAPFSHTGENFLRGNSDDCTNLHFILNQLVDSEEFNQNIPNEQSKSAAPHEIMSAIIGIKYFGSFFLDSTEKDLFARCITGYKYINTNAENSIKNCYIELLNSKVIDIDKMDYLIRDAYTTGFNTTNIDYQRLLSSLTINKEHELSYHKNAISVIENVIYAHDSERKWIQTHPIVMYESYLLTIAMTKLTQLIDSENAQFFSLQTLSSEGNSLNINGKNQTIRLLCDDDVIFLMKNNYYEDIGSEFFERSMRMRPAWKSEAEYKALVSEISTGGGMLDRFDNALTSLTKYLEKNTDSKKIDEMLLQTVKKELTELDEASEVLDIKSFETQKKQKKNILKVLEYLKQFAKDNNLPFEFVLLKVSQFSSGFGKPDFANISIVFESSTGEIIKKFNDVASSIVAKEKDRDNFYYLYYRRTESSLENKKLIEGLVGLFLHNSS